MRMGETAARLHVLALRFNGCMLRCGAQVNLWAVGKPNCIMSLTGHSSPVESVRFNHTEESVCAGSQAGTLKIWDLEAARLVRTHTGGAYSSRRVLYACI